MLAVLKNDISEPFKTVLAAILRALGAALCLHSAHFPSFLAELEASTAKLSQFIEAAGVVLNEMPGVMQESAGEALRQVLGALNDAALRHETKLSDREAAALKALEDRVKKLLSELDEKGRTAMDNLQTASGTAVGAVQAASDTAISALGVAETATRTRLDAEDRAASAASAARLERVPADVEAIVAPRLAAATAATDNAVAAAKGEVEAAATAGRNSLAKRSRELLAGWSGSANALATKQAEIASAMGQLGKEVTTATTRIGQLTAASDSLLVVHALPARARNFLSSCAVDLATSLECQPHTALFRGVVTISAPVCFAGVVVLPLALGGVSLLFASTSEPDRDAAARCVEQLHAMVAALGDGSSDEIVVVLSGTGSGLCAALSRSGEPVSDFMLTGVQLAQLFSDKIMESGMRGVAAEERASLLRRLPGVDVLP